MMNLRLTEEGKRYMNEYLNEAISFLDDEICNAVPGETVNVIRARRRLGKVRTLMSIAHAVQLPSNSATIRHDTPEELPF